MITLVLWVKFNDEDVECFCSKNNKSDDRCKDCSEYVVSFSKIDRTISDELTKSVETVSDNVANFKNNIKKLNSELKHVLNNSRRMFK